MRRLGSTTAAWGYHWVQMPRRKPHADADVLLFLRVEVDDRRFTLQEHERQPELVAAATVDEWRQSVLFVVHAVERSAVGTAHAQKGSPLVDDKVDGLVGHDKVDGVGRQGQLRLGAGCFWASAGVAVPSMLTQITAVAPETTRIAKNTDFRVTRLALSSSPPGKKFAAGVGPRPGRLPPPKSPM